MRMLWVLLAGAMCVAAAYVVSCHLDVLIARRRRARALDRLFEIRNHHRRYLSGSGVRYGTLDELMPRVVAEVEP